MHTHTHTQTNTHTHTHTWKITQTIKYHSCTDLQSNGCRSFSKASSVTACIRRRLCRWYPVENNSSQNPLFKVYLVQQNPSFKIIPKIKKKWSEDRCDPWSLLDLLPLRHSPVLDLLSLRHSPVLDLSLRNSPLSDLLSLRNSPLLDLSLRNSPLLDLLSLRHSPLLDLSLRNSPLLDLLSLHLYH